MSEQHDTGGIDWKTNGVKVIPGDQLDTNTPQTPGMNRAAAINFARVAAQIVYYLAAGSALGSPQRNTERHYSSPNQTMAEPLPPQTR